MSQGAHIVTIAGSRRTSLPPNVRVALVSMPWRRPNNAAIGLASLKAAVIGAGARCDVLYLNDRWFRFLIERGTFSEKLRKARYSDFARVISELAGVIHAGEWMFSSILFGSYQCQPELYRNIFEQAASGNEHREFATDFVANAELASTFVDHCIVSTDWNQYDIVGLSCVFYQLIPSLALAKKLRETGFKGKIVLGGPLCEGVVGRQILELFDFVDSVFDGESELSFPEYLRQVMTHQGGTLAPGVWQRSIDGTVFKADGVSAVRDMSSLPLPDYKDFFEELDRQGLVTRKEVAFPLEASRGCWWGQQHHCIFCGLNGSDMSYRTKSAERVYSELVSLHESYGISHFAFTDNIVSPKFMRPLMEMLAVQPLPVTFHAEIKANLSRNQIKQYKQAGFVYLQPGIESLSSRVLKIMDKGISALANVACLKYCREAGIVPFWNLLHSFPEETALDYEQTLLFLKAIVHLDPPIVVTPMRLTRFSPSFDNSVALGFHGKRPARFYRFMYPYGDDILANLVNSFEFEFADQLDRRSLLEPIEAFIDEWKGQKQIGTLVLDGHILYDSRFTRIVESRQLDPLQAIIYRLCDSPCNFKEIVNGVAVQFPEVLEGQIKAILEVFVNERTMLQEDDCYLSLAVHDAEFIPWQAIAFLDQMNLPGNDEEKNDMKVA